MSRSDWASPPRPMPPPYWVPVSLAILALASASSAASAQRQPQAVILSVQNPPSSRQAPALSRLSQATNRGTDTTGAHVDRGLRRLRQARSGMALYAGEALVLPAGCSAVIAYPDRPSESFAKALHTRTIPVGVAPAVDHRSCLWRMWQAVLQAILRRGYGRASTAGHLTSAAELPKVLSPTDTRERRVPVCFRWEGRPGASYTITVFDGAAVVWSAKNLGATECVWPTDAPAPVEARRYEWQVEMHQAGESRSPRCWFELLDQAERARVSQELADLEASATPGPSAVARHLARAALLAANGLRAEACEEAKAARRLRPDDDGLREYLDALVQAPTD